MTVRDDIFYWTTKDGRTLLVSEMEDRHLVNTVRMLRRNVEAYRLSYLSQMWRYMETAPDGAYDACDDAVRLIEEMSAEEFLKMARPCYSTMLSEVERRELTVPPVLLRDIEHIMLRALLTAVKHNGRR